MADAGRILIMPKGAYNPSVSYEMLDLVFHNDVSWIAKKPVIGVEPSDANADYWFKMVDNSGLQNIINGTTPVGNAKKLNELTDADFQKTMAVDAQTNTLMSLKDLVPYSGKARFVYLTGVPSDFPTNLGTPTSSGYLSVEVNKVGSLAYYNINAVKPNGTPFNITGYYTSGKFYWNNNADGGNADTVDGKHASDFVGKGQGYGWAGTNFSSYDINDWCRDGSYSYSPDCTNKPHGDYGTIFVVAPLGKNMIYQIGYDWNEAYQPLRARGSTNGGTTWSEWDYLNASVFAKYLPLDGSRSMTGALNAKGVVSAYSAFQEIALHSSDVESSGAGLFSLTHGTWLSQIDKNGKITHYGTATGNLPLDGSVPMNGGMQFLDRWGALMGDHAHARLQAYNARNDNNNYRALRILNSTYESNTENALEFYELNNGVGTNRKVLHTGNSAKVVVSSTPLTAEGSIRVW